MANDCKDFRTWHLGNLKDPTAAAYYLMAALEDALELDLPKHFVKAIIDVQKANGMIKGNIFSSMMNYLPQKEHAHVHELGMRILDKLLVAEVTALDVELV